MKPKPYPKTSYRIGEFGRYLAEAMSQHARANPSPGLSRKRPGQLIAQRSVRRTPTVEMTPIERMNRLHPDLRLQSLPDKFPDRDYLGEPDVNVCLHYFSSFLAAGESEGDKPVRIILEFLKKHPLEFICSGWVVPAVGYIVLGYPRLRTCKPRAKKLFAAYWRGIDSPLPKKQVGQYLQMRKWSRFLDSPHADHWRAVARWMGKPQHRNVAGDERFGEYARTHPQRCSCIDQENFTVIKKGLRKASETTNELYSRPFCGDPRGRGK